MIRTLSIEKSAVQSYAHMAIATTYSVGISQKFLIDYNIIIIIAKVDTGTPYTKKAK